MNPFDALTWVVNGLLAVIYVLCDRIFILLLVLPLAYLLGRAPGEQRPWITASGTLALLAAGFVPPPVLLLLTFLAWAGALAVKLDRFNPKGLRWRASGGIALYALAALGFSGYAAYASRIDANAWANVVSGGDCRAGARLPEHAGGLGAVGDPARRIPSAPAAGHLCSRAHTGVTSGDDPRRAWPGLPGGRCWWLVH